MALCGTARGAREQQRLRTWIGCPFSESVPDGPLGGGVEAYSGSLAEPPGCDDAMNCRYGTETKMFGKHLNSSAGYFPTGRPVTDYARLKICLPIAAAGWS